MILALLIVAAVLAAITLIQSHFYSLLAWAILALAAAQLVPRLT